MDQSKDRFDEREGIYIYIYRERERKGGRELYRDVSHNLHSQQLTFYTDYYREFPDILIDPVYDTFLGSFLFVDISGFTPLSAKLGAEGSHGIEKLSTILNEYFSLQITIITSHGGDVLKFAGDALQALWKEDRSSSHGKSDVNIRAAQCALDLKKQLNGYECDGSVLSVKISIGYGEMASYHVGGEKHVS